MEQETQETPTTPVRGPQDPYDLLKEVGGPSKDEVAGLKAQTPNGQIKIFTLDGGKRIYLLRAVSLMELSALSKQLPKNSDPETASRELPLLVVSKCCVWTNTTRSSKLSAEELRAGAAGLSNTLYLFIEMMSDYVDPSRFDLISSDI